MTAKAPPGPIETVINETMTTPPATDVLDRWIAIDINNPLPGGQKVISDNAIELYAAGSDVYGTEDQFRFVYQKLSGDFTLSATMDYLTFTNTYAKAGLMIRQDLEKDSVFASINIFPDGSVEYGARPAKGQNVWTKIVMGPELPEIQLKLVRKGNVIERYFACGGSDWDKLDSVEFEDLPADIYAGLFCTSHDNQTLATAKFRDIVIQSN